MNLCIQGFVGLAVCGGGILDVGFVENGFVYVVACGGELGAL